MHKELITERLILRPWKNEDRKPFAELNADPRVMEYIGVKTEEESNATLKNFMAHFDRYGWGFWAVEVPGVSDFIGMIGLGHVTFSAPFTPAVEIGWRLAHAYWGKGYALEGARAAIKYGFTTLKLAEIVSFTVVQNRRSRHLMEKLGMHRDPKEDFDHPKLPEGHPLRRHVLYRITQK